MPQLRLFNILMGISKSPAAYEYNGQITGVNFEALESLGYQVTEGQLPSGTDTPSYTLLFGATAAYDFYNPKKRNGWISMMPDANGNLPDPYVNPMEDKLEIEVQVNGDTNKKVKPVKATCIGIMAEDWSKNPSPYGVFMDIKDVKALQKEYNKANNVKEDPSKKESYTQVIVKTDDMSSVAAVEEVIQSYGFNTSSMESIRKPLEEQSRTMQLFLGGIGAVSLLVAAFGIINTMTMSIYERTKEIGVMKVIGCRIGNIRTMFLMEAAAIGFMGGVIGVILSEGVSYAANTFSGDGGGLGGMFGMGMGGGGQLSIIPPWLIYAHRPDRRTVPREPRRADQRAVRHPSGIGSVQTSLQRLAGLFSSGYGSNIPESSVCCLTKDLPLTAALRTGAAVLLCIFKRFARFF